MKGFGRDVCEAWRGHSKISGHGHRVKGVRVYFVEWIISKVQTIATDTVEGIPMYMGDLVVGKASVKEKKS